jgi:hypothetical protein
VRTAVSIPDELFRRADRFASRTGRSRSQLYAEVRSAFLDDELGDPVTTALNDLAPELNAEPRLGARVGRSLIESGDWEW